VFRDIIVTVFDCIYFADDDRTRIFFQNKSRKQQQEFITPENFPIVRYRAQTVRITVIGNADVCLFFFDQGE